MSFDLRSSSSASSPHPVSVSEVLASGDYANPEGEGAVSAPSGTVPPGASPADDHSDFCSWIGSRPVRLRRTRSNSSVGSPSSVEGSNPRLSSDKYDSLPAIAALGGKVRIGDPVSEEVRPAHRPFELDGALMSLGDWEDFESRKQARLNCGRYWARVERQMATPDGLREERLVVPLGCGWRGCQTCSKKIRQAHADRIRGPWRTCGVLTFPRWGWSRGEALRAVGPLLKRLWDCVRAAVRRGNANVKMGIDSVVANGRRIGSFRDFHYSWVLELHPSSGWAHIHWCTTADRIEWPWLRAQWGRLVGFDRVFVSAHKVKHLSSHNRYLCKYMSKQVFEDRDLAILGKRRSWACTLPVRPVEGPGWAICEIGEESVVASGVETPVTDMKGGEWLISWEAGNGLVLLSREVPCRELLDSGNLEREIMLDEVLAAMLGFCVDSNDIYDGNQACNLG
jgi:hypothetical protein